MLFGFIHICLRALQMEGGGGGGGDGEGSSTCSHLHTPLYCSLLVGRGTPTPPPAVYVWCSKFEDRYND